MRPLYSDALISAGALLVLLVTLVSIDARVRDLIADSLRRASVSSTSAQLSGVGSIVLEAAFEQGVAHAPLAIFSVAALVLVVFMLKTL